MAHPYLALEERREKVRRRLFDAMTDYDETPKDERPDWLAARVRGLVREYRSLYVGAWK